jgi:hypothetical protein
MEGFDLSQYVRQQLESGFSPEQVKAYLVSYGYRESDVDKALRANMPSNAGADPRLVDYIRRYASQGHDPAAIASYLKQNNYPSSEVDRAMREAVPRYGDSIRHTIDLSGRTIVTILIVLAAVGMLGGLTYYIVSKPSTPQLLDYRITIDQKSVEPGGTLYFTNTFVNIGDSPKYDLFLNYRVVRLSDGEPIHEWGETIGVDDIESPSRPFDIAEDAVAGRYRLEGVARYGKENATAFESFEIVRPNATSETCIDGIKNQGEEDVDCGGPCGPCDIEESCDDGMRDQDETGIDCGGVCLPCKVVESCIDDVKDQDETGVDCGGVCKPCESTIVPDNRQILSKVRSLGSFNEAESMRLCNTIDEERLRDDCFLDLSQTFNKTTYCEKLIAASKANICYMNFVQKGDYTVCPNISEVNTRRICESLRQINTLIAKQNLTMDAGNFSVS